MNSLLTWLDGLWFVLVVDNCIKTTVKTVLVTLSLDYLYTHNNLVENLSF